MLPLQFTTVRVSPLVSSTNYYCSSRITPRSLLNPQKHLLRFNATVRVFAMSDNSSPSSFKMNLNEYLVTLEKPLGIRFALTADGKIIVHSLTKGGNAERSRIIMVGDTLKKAGDSSQNSLFVIKDVGDTQYAFEF